MENVLLTILLIFALALIAVVLLQRSEGGGLGLGGGGGGGVMSARGAATALARVTWFLGAGFFVAAMALTVLSARNAANSSVVSGADIPPASAPALPGNLTLPAGTDFAPAPDVQNMMPPAAETPDAPPPADAPDTPPPAE